jgi:hypothetical protein
MNLVRILAMAWWMTVFFLGACGDDDDDSGGAAGEPDDDDAASDDDDDDDNDNDSDDDDDGSPDDDDNDDSSPDDDDNDDDDDDDDDNNDDLSPVECPNGYLAPNGVCIERALGRSPGAGTSALVDEAGVIGVAAIMGRELALYEIDPAEDPIAPIVTKIDDMAAQPSLARDAAGNLRLVYLDMWTDRVKFGANDGKGWSIETISPAGHHIWYVAAAIDADGRSHVAYVDGSDQTLVYLTNASGAWTSETLLYFEQNPSSVALAVGPQNVVGVAAAVWDWTGGSGLGTTIHLFSNETGEWASQSLAENGSGASVALAIDSQSAAHLAFNLQGTAGNTLKYASNAGGAWELERLTTDIAWWGIALTVDDEDAPHVIYSTANDVTVTMGVKQDDAWGYQDIDGHDFIGMSPAMALDGGGRAHAAYTSQSRLRAARENARDWDCWTIDEDAAVDNPTSLAVDAGGVSHAALLNGDATVLRYANNSAGAWAAEEIVAGIVGYGSLAVDSQGRPDVVTYLEGDIVRYVKDGDGWTYEVVDDTPYSTGESTCFKLDEKDGGHVTHMAYTQDQVEFRYVSDRTGSWVVEVVAAVNRIDWAVSSSLAVDADRAAHIAFVWAAPETRGATLRYATNGAGRWDIETVTPEWHAGDGCSIALDSAGNPHIAHFVQSVGSPPDEKLALGYSRKSGGQWINEIVDTTRYCGQFTSIALDENDAVHISHHDLDDSALRYTTNASGQWESHVVDPAGWSGLYTSLALYGDEVRILYMADYSAYQARFARAGAAR